MMLWITRAAIWNTFVIVSKPYISFVFVVVVAFLVSFSFYADDIALLQICPFGGSGRLIYTLAVVTENSRGGFDDYDDEVDDDDDDDFDT
jgi:hypothetical protein